MYLFYEQNRTNDIVWGSQEDKVPVAKTVKKSAYGKCSKISNTLKLRTPNIIAENNF